MEQNTKSGGGRTLINGTGYEIILKQKTVSITIIGSFASGSYIEVAGTKYTAAANIEVQEGESIKVHAGGASSFPKIFLNGTQVARGNGTGANYTLSTAGMASVGIRLTYLTSANYGAYNKIDIETKAL